MKHLSIISLLLILAVFLGLGPTLLSQSETFCPPGQSPQFILGFAFLKQQLGGIMGEPLECEHYDAAGNAYQETTTGQAFYLKRTNRPMFTAGNRHWAWTLRGLEQWVDKGEEAGDTVTPPLTTPTTVRVMSYNILFGAGVDPSWERIAAQQRPFSNPGNRLPQILTVIKAAEPDILGLQEAAGWDNGAPAVAQQVADELDMNYFLATNKTGLHLALFTKFNIVEGENLSDKIGNIGVLRAVLSTTGPSQLIHVFVVHLDPFSATVREHEIATLTQVMAPYLPYPTILMGDTNITCLNEPETCQEFRLLRQAGWQLVVKDKYLINQIWTSPCLASPISEITFPGASFHISDHLPVGAAIEIGPTR